MATQTLPAVTSPIYFTGKTPEYIGYVAKNDKADVSDKTEFTFSPSKDFIFKFSKDKDCNIDIWIHTNPKNICKDIKDAILFMKKKS